MVYAGSRACVYESAKNPGTAILRITGFDYSDGPEPGETIDSIESETEELYQWWVNHATWSHLIFDLIDNHGGNFPRGYYQMIFQNEFQDQYVTFKKTPEMEDPVMRRSLFWDSNELEIWFQNLIANGSWAKMSYGSYTSSVPMFCPVIDQDCSLGRFPNRPHPFRGRVSVLLNHWCVSACDGFAYSMKEKFGAQAKFYGTPQAADTGFSRMTINIFLDELNANGFYLNVVPLGDPSSQQAFVSQTVVVSRSTTQDATIVSGKPVPLDGFVPITLQNRNFWANEVLKRAL